MKNLILSLCLLCASARAENYVAVWFYGVNANGVATNFPISWKSLGTNAAYSGPNAATATILTVKDALALKSATQPSMDAYLASKAASDQSANDTLNAANVQALMSSYSNLQWCADNWASQTNTAQLRNCLGVVGQTLLRLKPVLVEWYQKSQQP